MATNFSITLERNGIFAIGLYNEQTDQARDQVSSVSSEPVRISKKLGRLQLQ